MEPRRHEAPRRHEDTLYKKRFRTTGEQNYLRRGRPSGRPARPSGRGLRFCIVILAAAVACSRPGGVERAAPGPVSLPDLSRASESVKAQLRDGYASLTRTTGAPNATPAERAAAYGRMGMLFMAAEYRDEAERCLLAAQALAPDDRRWPYYLAHLYRAQGDAEKSAA